MAEYVFHNLIDYAYDNAKTPHSIRVFLEMKDPVDESVLRRAIDTGMKRYPYFCVELTICKNRYKYIPNHRPIRLSCGETPTTLCGPEANYHQMAVRYYKNRIYFDFNHCFFDGYLCNNVMKTIVYHYCCDFYNESIEPKNINAYVEGMEIPKEEWENPLEHVKGDRVSYYLHPRMPENPFSLEDTFEPDGITTDFRVEFDEKEVIDFCKNSDGSPNALFHVLVSRAIAKLNPDTDAIRSSVCIHMGKFLNVKMSSAGMTSVVMIPYLDSMKKYSLRDQVTLTKGMIMVNCDEDNVKKIIQNTAARARYWAEGETLEENLTRCMSEPYNPLDFSTFVISYSRESELGPLSKYVTDFSASSYLFVPMLVEIANVNQKFMIDFLQTFSDRKYFDAFLQELDEAKIHYRLKATESGELSKLDFQRIVNPC